MIMYNTVMKLLKLVVPSNLYSINFHLIKFNYRGIQPLG